MITHVRALIQAAPKGSALLAAPDGVLDTLAEVVPDAANRFVLEGLSGGPKALLASGARTGRWARARGATVLHGHGLRLIPLFASASASSGLPLVVTLHNLVPDNLSPASRAVLRVCLQGASRIIAVSRAVGESARNAGIVSRSSARIIVVHNGVDITRYENSAAARATKRKAVRDALQIDADAPVALCVARLSPEKGVATFLEAASLLRARNGEPLRDARFLIAGDGPLRPSLVFQTERLGLADAAQLLGARNDIPDLLASVDVFCLPSREEGLSLAVIEAMAAGLPVAASRVGGVPELVDDGKTGLLVPPGDPVELAHALETLLRNLPAARAMGAYGQARARAHFSEGAMLEGTHAVYAAAVRRGRS